MHDDAGPIQIALPEGRAHTVHVGPIEGLPGALAQTGLTPGRALVVTDAHVAPYHLPRLDALLRGAGWAPHAVVLPPGEATKSADHLAHLYDAALAAGVERSSPLLAFGGGVVGDLAGFAAATLLRGLPLVQIPTSLVAQVDAAIGGKTGINHARGKNLIGAFHFPRLVFADPALLTTLPPEEHAAGLAEVVKSALVADADFFAWLEAEWEAVAARERDEAVVRRTAAIKAAIVSADPFEAGLRAVLNFGHTFGHAVEHALGFGAARHGEAVALGMRAALHLSASVRAGATAGALPTDFARADRLVRRLPRPALPDGLSNAVLTLALGADKKRAAGLRYIVLDQIGAARVAADVPPAWVDAAWSFARNG